MPELSRVLVTGGGGYVGARLVPRLLEQGYLVRVLDVFWFGRDALAEVDGHGSLEVIEGDIRDGACVERALQGVDAVIHLACISNDPSFDLDPDLGRSINFEAFEPFVDAAVAAGAKRFIYASSSSVYGVSDAADIQEDHPLLPLTDYSKYKAACEPLLLRRASDSFCPVVIRPATLCGYSPRQRLDLTVNILTNHAVNRGKITVFGGEQKRPNLHIEDMVDLYMLLLAMKTERVRGRVYNAGYENHTVAELAQRVQSVVDSMAPNPVTVETKQSDDARSYHISSQRIRHELKFIPKRSIERAVQDLIAAFAAGRLQDPMDDDRYYNVRRMQRVVAEAKET
jgi:nucleoside-diphosphate-sugar epimerase